MPKRGDTDVQLFIESLNAGVLMEQMGNVLSQVAQAVHDTDKQGEVTLKLKFKSMGGGQQIMCEHDLSYKKPKDKGAISENDTSNTPMYVGTLGRMTLYPERQEDAFMGDEKRTQETGPRSEAQRPKSAPSLVGIPGKQ